MASTYDNDLRLEEMATGENSGSWGTKTNTNLELIADAFSYGTETIADADTTIEIQDGTADAARSLALKINSSTNLTTTRVITLAPNTTSKVWIIENNTSGGQVLTISAGSGSNVTLPNGVTKIIATDGIGAAANVTELYTNLHNITIDGILSLADGTNSAPSLTNTGDTNTGLYFPAADEVGLTVAGTQRLNINSTGSTLTGIAISNGLTLNTLALPSAGTATIFNRNTDSSLYIQTSSGNTVYLLDGSQNTMYAAAPTSHSFAISNVGVNTITATESVFNETGLDRDFRVESNNNADMLFVDGDEDQVRIGTSTDIPDNAFVVQSTSGAGAIAIKGRSSDDIGSLAFYENDATTQLGNLQARVGSMRHRMLSNGGTMMFENNDSGGTLHTRFQLGATEALFNDNGSDYDFRVESDTLPNAFFVNGATSKIGIGEGAVGGTDDWTGSSWTGLMFKEGSTIASFQAAAYPAINITENGFPNGTSFQSGFLRSNTGNATNIQLDRGDMFFRTAASAAAGSEITWVETLNLLDNSNGAVFNEGGSDRDFRVESDSNAHAIFVDGALNNVGIMDATPTSTLNVHGNKSFVWNASGIENVATTTIGSRTTTDGSNSFAVAGTTHNSYYPSSWVVNSAHDGTTNTTFFDLTAYGVKAGGWTGVMRLNTSQGVSVHEALRLRDSEAVFNELGNNTDFRVESDAGPYAFYMDAGANSGYGRTKITSYAPSSNTSVEGGTSDTYINGLTIENNEASYTNGGLALVNKQSWGYGSSIKWYNIYDGAGTSGTLGETNRIQSQYVSANNMDTVFYSMIGASVTETLSLGASGTIFNDGGIDNDFRVESDTISDAFTVNGANGVVSANGSAFAVGNHTGSFNQDGTYISNNSGSFMYMERSGSGNSVMYIHRRTSDGNLIEFHSQAVIEGSISVAGTTVSYNGFCGTHDSSGSGVSISTPVGTVLSTIDEEHKSDHAKVKVSDSVGDKRVYGVLQQYKETTTSGDTKQIRPEHAVVASVGIASVRVTGACEGGDLLESNGDGTAKVQSDDIVRSKTLGKVTIGNSDTGVKLVSCVMYCG